MKRRGYLIWVVGLIQLVLGLLYLFVPAHLLHWMGHSPIPTDTAYPLGMLASRFIVYGVLFCLVARNPMKHLLLVAGMASIQLLDLLIGVYYTSTGVVSLHLSGFPIFNAVWICALCMFLVLGKDESYARVPHSMETK
jgi:hypothetical protein